jgi:hypothetical protein
VAARRIPMPGPHDVPPGPHRDLLVALHQLYRGAGLPSLRQIADAARDGDYRDTVSHEKVSAILHGCGLPRWSKLEVVVQVLADWHIPAVTSRPRPPGCIGCGSPRKTHIPTMKPTVQPRPALRPARSTSRTSTQGHATQPTRTTPFGHSAPKSQPVSAPTAQPTFSAAIVTEPTSPATSPQRTS